MSQTALLRGSLRALFLALIGCASAPAARPPSNDAAPRDQLGVSTGSVSMNGSTEVRCALRKEGRDLALLVSVSTRCPTTRGVAFTVTSGGRALLTDTIDEALELDVEGKPKRFELIPLPMLAIGTEVHTRVDAHCIGRAGAAFGAARCVVAE